MPITLIRELPIQPDEANHKRNQAFRVSQRREHNQLEDPRTDRLVVLHDAFSAADLPGTEPAEWGAPVGVAGFERLHLFLDYEHGGSNHTTVSVVAQASPISNPESELWFDIFEDNDGDLTVTREVWATATGGVDFKRMWSEMRRRGYFMRFKVFGNGATPTDSRALLTAIRVMDGH